METRVQVSPAPRLLRLQGTRSPGRRLTRHHSVSSGPRVLSGQHAFSSAAAVSPGLPKPRPHQPSQAKKEPFSVGLEFLTQRNLVSLRGVLNQRAGKQRPCQCVQNSGSPRSEPAREPVVPWLWQKKIEFWKLVGDIYFSFSRDDANHLWKMAPRDVSCGYRPFFFFLRARPYFRTGVDSQQNWVGSTETFSMRPACMRSLPTSDAAHLGGSARGQRLRWRSVSAPSSLLQSLTFRPCAVCEFSQMYKNMFLHWLSFFFLRNYLYSEGKKCHHYFKI